MIPALIALAAEVVALALFVGMLLIWAAVLGGFA